MGLRNTQPGNARLLFTGRFRFLPLLELWHAASPWALPVLSDSSSLQALVPSVDMTTARNSWDDRSGSKSPRASTIPGEQEAAKARNSWDDRSGPKSPRASTIPGEQEAAKAAVVDEAALLAEEFCAALLLLCFSAASPPIASFLSGVWRAPPPLGRGLYRRLHHAARPFLMGSRQLRLQLAEAQERTSIGCSVRD